MAGVAKSEILLAHPSRIPFTFQNGLLRLWSKLELVNRVLLGVEIAGLHRIKVSPRVLTFFDF